MPVNRNHTFPPVAVCILVNGGIHPAVDCIAAVQAGRNYQELLVLANGCEHATQRALERISGVCVHVAAGNMGVIRGRNYLAEKAMSEYLLFLDDDQIVSPDSLNKIYDVARAGNIDLVGTILNIVNEQGIGRPANEITDDPRHYFGGGGLLIRRDAFKRLGGFDAAYGMAYCEDADLFWRARSAEVSWAWCADAGIEHRPHATLRADNATLGFDLKYQYEKSHSILRGRWPEIIAGTKQFSEPETEMNAAARVAILVMVHDGYETFVKCFDRLLSATDAEHSHVFLLLNGVSENEIWDYANELDADRVTVYVTRDNLYCAPGRAFLIEQIIESGVYDDYKYYFLLDDDVELVGDRVDETIKRAFSWNPAAAVTGLLLNEQGRVQEGPSTLRFTGNTFQRTLQPGVDRVCPSDFGCGGFTAFRSDVLRRHYRYLALYPAGYADVDMMFRMRIARQTVQFNPAIKGIHHHQWGSADPRRANWRNPANRTASVLRFKAIWGMVDQYALTNYADYEAELFDQCGADRAAFMGLGFAQAGSVLK